MHDRRAIACVNEASDVIMFTESPCFSIVAMTKSQYTTSILWTSPVAVTIALVFLSTTKKYLRVALSLCCRLHWRHLGGRIDPFIRYNTTQINWKPGENLVICFYIEEYDCAVTDAVADSRVGVQSSETTTTTVQLMTYSVIKWRHRIIVTSMTSKGGHYRLLSVNIWNW